MQRLLSILIVIGLIAGAGYLLIRNKRILQEESERAAATTNITPAVSITYTRLDTFVMTFEASGNLVPAQQVMLIATVQGEVEQVYVKRGDKLQKGQPMAKVDDSYLQTEMIAVQANYDKSRGDLERFERLVAGNAATQQQFEQVTLAFQAASTKLTALQQRLADTEIKAPISGILHEWYISTGSTIGQGAKVGEIVNVNALKLTVKVAEKEVILIRNGQLVNIEVGVLAQTPLTGKVGYVGVKPGRDQLYEVEIEVANQQNQLLRAGMFATAIFETTSPQVGMLITRNALVGNLDDPKVYVVNKEKARLRQIEIGKIMDTQIEVLSGLMEQEAIVVDGQINIRDGISVRIVETIE